MAQGGMTPNQDKYDKHKSEIFEYEDFGQPTMYLWAVKMKALRVRKRLWIKPRTCPECGRFCIVARHYLSEHCDRCHRINAHRKKRERFRAKFGHPKGKYTSGYKAARKRLIEKHPYCALCGTPENLTAHHIGGGLDKNKMTVLCNECHDAYERFNNKRKVKKCFHNVKSALLNG